EHLGGRYQEGGSTEEVARLKEITVDPKTVVLAKKIDSGSVGVPKVVTDLQVGSYNYQVKLEIGGQQINLKASTKIQDGAGAWTAIDQVETPQGTAIDTVTLDKQSLT